MPRVVAAEVLAVELVAAVHRRSAAFHSSSLHARRRCVFVVERRAGRRRRSSSGRGTRTGCPCDSRLLAARARSRLSVPSTLTWCAVSGVNSARVESSAARWKIASISNSASNALEQRRVEDRPVNSRATSRRERLVERVDVERDDARDSPSCGQRGDQAVADLAVGAGDQDDGFSARSCQATSRARSARLRAARPAVAARPTTACDRLRLPQIDARLPPAASSDGRCRRPGAAEVASRPPRARTRSAPSLDLLHAAAPTRRSRSRTGRRSTASRRSAGCAPRSRATARRSVDRVAVVRRAAGRDRSRSSASAVIGSPCSTRRCACSSKSANSTCV